MSSLIKLSYGSPTSITCTLSGLADGSAQQSTSVDNGTNLFLDVLVQLKIVYPNSTPTGNVVAYFVASLDGTNFDGAATGSDGSYDYGTLGASLPSIIDGMTPIQNGTQYATESIGDFIGFVPPKWSIVVVNNTGFALSAGSSITYLGVKAQVG